MDLRVCHEIFGPGQNLIWPDKIYGPPQPQTILREADAFRSVKVRTSETAREMCADENEDLVEKPCLHLLDGRYPEGSTSNEKRAIRRRLQHLL